MHISYCTGEAGRQVAAASSAQNMLIGSSTLPDDSTSISPEAGGNKGKQQKSDIDVARLLFSLVPPFELACRLLISAISWLGLCVDEGEVGNTE